MQLWPIAAIFVGSLAVGAYALQFLLIYPSSFPEGSRTTVDTPSTYGLNYVEKTLLTPDGENIRIYVIPSRKPTNLTVFFLGPNAGNMGHYLPAAGRVHVMDINVVTLSYRGYGKSTGRPSEKGLKTDVETALKYINTHYPDWRIVLYGRSLGGAVAIYAATSLPQAQHKIAGVILENTFTSILDVVPNVLPRFVAWLARFVLTQRWESYKLIPKLKCPVMFQAGGRDELISPPIFKRLFELCGSPNKEYNLYPAGMHNDTIVQPKYWENMERFLKKLE